MKHNILLPGGGGPAAIGTIKSLRMTDFDGKIVTTDSNPLSAGFHLADKYYVLPKVKEENFLPEALKVIKKEEINSILSTSGFDIIKYSKNKKELEEMGVNVIISDYETIETCIDKWKFYQKLKNKFNLPKTTLNSEETEFPCFIKPIKGKGSRNTYLCENSKELDHYLSKHKNMLIQEYLPGEEYTIDVLSDLKSNPIVAVPRVRIETRGGISVKGRITHNKQIQETCLKVAKFLKIIGPSCMQMKLDKNQEPRLTEVNPRIGGGTIFTTFAGVNIPKLILDLIENRKITLKDFDDITVLRYFQEVVLGDNKHESFSLRGTSRRH